MLSNLLIEKVHNNNSFEIGCLACHLIREEGSKSRTEIICRRYIQGGQERIAVSPVAAKNRPEKKRAGNEEHAPHGRVRSLARLHRGEKIMDLSVI